VRTADRDATVRPLSASRGAAAVSVVPVVPVVSARAGGSPSRGGSGVPAPTVMPALAAGPAFFAGPASPALPAFHFAAVRSLPRRGRLVHLYGRQHIDLQRVAGALCCR
jgi:hypothetical protein